MWNRLISLRLGLLLLALLAVASVAGTLISPLERAQQLVFYAWWYKLLLLGLCINIGCATFNTLVKKILPAQHPHFHRSPEFYSDISPAASVPFASDAEAAAQAFRRKGFRVHTDGPFGHARTGHASLWGGPVSHLGLLVILLGGFASNWVAREGMVELPEGASTEIMHLRVPPRGETPLGFTLQVDDFATGFFPRTQIPSHFISTVTAFQGPRVIFSGPVEVNHSPKVLGWRLHQTNYRELEGGARYHLTFSRSGAAAKATEQFDLEVSPGQLRPLPGVRNVFAGIREEYPPRWVIAGPDGILAEGALINASATSSTLRIEARRFEPDFVIGADREVGSRSTELNNPALFVVLRDGDQDLTSQWLFGLESMKAMMHGAMAGPYRLEFERILGEGDARRFVVIAEEVVSGLPVGRYELSLGRSVPLIAVDDTSVDAAPSTGCEAEWRLAAMKRVPAYATTLTLTRNPAIPLIYLGCALMMLGLALSFFIPRRDVWFWVDAERGHLRIAAAYRYGRTEFDSRTRSAIEDIQ